MMAPRSQAPLGNACPGSSASCEVGGGLTEVAAERAPEMIWHTGCTLASTIGTDASGSRVVLVAEHAGCKQRFDA